MDNEKEKTYWLATAEMGIKYETSTWYRCVGLQQFLEKVEKEHQIVAFVVSGNNIGFILDPVSICCKAPMYQSGACTTCGADGRPDKK